MFDPLRSVPVQVAPHLVGQKSAVFDGNALHVSPAMYDLMKNADEEELQKICSKIGFIDISVEEVTLLINRRPPVGSPF